MSAYIPLYGFGKAAEQLNLFVLGGTEPPAAPKENTLWVNTDQEITAWAFSADAPGEPVEGMVWLRNGEESATPINVLKKNNATVYPCAAAQYLSGSWQEKEGMVWQDGQWKGWIKYLFRYGDTFDALSGGWSNVSGDHLVQTYNGSASKSGTTSALKDATFLNFTYAVTNVHGSENGNISILVQSASGTKLANMSIATKGKTVGQVYTDSLNVASVTEDCCITFGGWYGSAAYYELWVA